MKMIRSSDGIVELRRRARRILYDFVDSGESEVRIVPDSSDDVTPCDLCDQLAQVLRQEQKLSDRLAGVFVWYSRKYDDLHISREREV